MDGNPVAFPPDIGRVGTNSSSENLRKCALSGAILAHQRMNFTAEDRKMSVVQSPHTIVMFVGVLNSNQLGHLGFCVAE